MTQLQKIAQRALNTGVLANNLVYSKAQQAPYKPEVNNTFGNFFSNRFLSVKNQTDNIDAGDDDLNDTVLVFLSFVNENTGDLLERSLFMIKFFVLNLLFN